MPTGSRLADVRNRTTQPAREIRVAIAPAIAAITLVLAACNSPNVPPGNYGIVTGTITSSNGQPVAGVVVLADYGTSGTSASDGRYTINTVPISSSTSPTTISIQASSVPAGYRVPAPQMVQVIAGQTTPNINFVLQPG